MYSYRPEDSKSVKNGRFQQEPIPFSYASIRMGNSLHYTENASSQGRSRPSHSILQETNSVAVEQLKIPSTEELMREISKLKKEKMTAINRTHEIERRLREVENSISQCVEEQEANIIRLKTQHQETIQKTKSDHQQYIRELNIVSEERIEKLHKEHQREKSRIKAENQEVIQRIRIDFEKEKRMQEIQRDKLNQQQEKKSQLLQQESKTQLQNLQRKNEEALAQLNSKHSDKIKQLSLKKEGQIRHLQEQISQINRERQHQKEKHQSELRERQLHHRKEVQQLTSQYDDNIAQLRSSSQRELIKAKSDETSTFKFRLEQKQETIKRLENKLKELQTVQMQLRGDIKSISIEHQAKLNRTDGQFSQKLRKMEEQHRHSIQILENQHKKQLYSKVQSHIVEQLKREQQEKLRKVNQKHHLEIQDLRTALIREKDEHQTIVSNLRKDFNRELSQKDEHFRKEFSLVEKSFQEEQNKWQKSFEEAVQDCTRQISKIKDQNHRENLKIKKAAQGQLAVQNMQKSQEIKKIENQLNNFKMKNKELSKEVEALKNSKTQMEVDFNKKNSTHQQEKLKFTKRIDVLQEQLRGLNQRLEEQLRISAQYKATVSEMEVQFQEKLKRSEQIYSELRMKELKDKVEEIEQDHKAQIENLNKSYEKVFEQKELKHKIELKCIQDKIHLLNEVIRSKDKELANERKSNEENIQTLLVQKKQHSPEKPPSSALKPANAKTSSQDSQSNQNEFILQKVPEIMKYLRSVQAERDSLRQQLVALMNTNKELRQRMSANLSNFNKEKELLEQNSTLKAKLKYYEEAAKQSPRKTERSLTRGKQQLIRLKSEESLQKRPSIQKQRMRAILSPTVSSQYVRQPANESFKQFSAKKKPRFNMSTVYIEDFPKVTQDRRTTPSGKILNNYSMRSLLRTNPEDNLY